MPGILIIDDDPARLTSLTLLLTGAGHAVMFATDAEGGLTMARFSRPALILMDASVHGMEGVAATAILRDDPLTADIPILAPGALAMGTELGTRRRAASHGCMTRHDRYRVYDAIDWLLAPSAALTGPADGSS